MADVQTLPSKSKPGLDLDQVFTPGRNSGAVQPAPGAPRYSKPDLVIPKAEAMADEDWFPVRMLRNYRPVGGYQTGQEDEETGAVIKWHEMPELTGDANPGLELQVHEGQLIHLRKSEAKIVIKAEIADRADPID